LPTVQREGHSLCEVVYQDWMWLPSPPEDTTLELYATFTKTNYRRSVDGLLDILLLGTVVDQWHEFVNNLEVHLLVVVLSMASEKAHDVLDRFTLQLIPLDFLGSDTPMDITLDAEDSRSCLLRVGASDVVWVCFQSLRLYSMGLNPLTGQQPDLGFVVELYFMKMGLLCARMFDCSMNLLRRSLTVLYFQTICIRPITIVLSRMRLRLRPT
jgi:hypothetical protein